MHGHCKAVSIFDEFKCKRSCTVLLLHLVCFLCRHLSDLLLGIALLYQDVTWLFVAMLYFAVVVMVGSSIIFFTHVSGMLNMTLSVFQLFKIILFSLLYPTLFDCNPHIIKSVGYKKLRSLRSPISKMYPTFIKRLRCPCWEHTGQIHQLPFKGCHAILKKVLAITIL